MSPTDVRKVVVIGTSGCGKTTLGEEISKHIHAKFVDLDDLYWLPDWTPREDDEFINALKDELSTDKWVVCGNYSRARSEFWPKADMIIWLDIPLRTCLWRGLKRSLSRIFKNEVCCNGNYESVRRLIGKDSILLWIWKTYDRRKKAYSEYFSLYTGKQQLVRLKSKIEVNEFIKSSFCGP